jgi:DNA-binding CsgD family transcriptional regulator
VHAALAEATDPERDPDRRAWHRAQAAAGPDEDVAGELERSADRARARGGLAAAAAFLERAVVLTLDPAQRARRALAAARTKVQAGAFGAGLDLLSMAEMGPLSELERARADLLRAQMAFYVYRGKETTTQLLNVASRLESIDAGLSRATYLDALSAAVFAGHLARPAGDVLAVARAAGAAPQPMYAPRASDLLLDGLAAHYTLGYAAGLPILRRALSSFGTSTELSYDLVNPAPDEELRWGWLASIAAVHVWDDERWDARSTRSVQLARGSGSLSELPLALASRAQMLLFAGELTAAESVIAEVQAVAEATGSNLPPYGALVLAALRGDEEASAPIEATRRDATLRGEGIGIALAGWAEAVLNNGLARYQRAMAAAQQASSYNGGLGPSNWALVELIEAAARDGSDDTAANALGRLAEMTSPSGTDWALGIETRCRALLTEGEAAERLYREAVERLARTRLRPDLARAHLLFGEWLRRERRRTEAREQLRTAHDMLATMGMQAFAERARRGLRATGETARRRTAAAGTNQLTAHEAQIARLARDGMSNPEIGARLFLSPRTVQYHLGNVFAKLGINSRSQLDRVLPGGPAVVKPPR